MKKSIFILVTLGLFNLLCHGQTNPDIYQIKIGKYSFEAFDRPHFETKKSFTITIQLPTYLQYGITVDAEGREEKICDTITHLELTKLIDSIPRKAVPTFIDTEIEVYAKGIKLKVERIGLTVFRANGEPYRINFESNKISGNSGITKFIKKCPANSYIVLDGIWFYTSTGDRIIITDQLGWKIVK